MAFPFPGMKSTAECWFSQMPKQKENTKAVILQYIMHQFPIFVLASEHVHSVYK